MKLTKREAVLVLTLVAALVLGGSYKFLIQPQMKKVEALKSEIRENEQNVQRVKREIQPNNRTDKEFKILNQKVQMSTKGFFPTVIQEKLILLMNQKASQNSLSIESVQFTEIEIGKIKENEEAKQKTKAQMVVSNIVQQYNELQPGEKKQTTEEQSQSDKSTVKKGNVEQQNVEKMMATITFKGSYEALSGFIYAVENHDKKIVIRDVVAENQGNNLLVGTISLQFYAFPKLNKQKEDSEYLSWNIKNPYGKLNPFVSIGGYTLPSAKPVTTDPKKVGPTVEAAPSAVQQAIAQNLKANYDFIMTVKPTSADLPTVVLGKSKDVGARTYVYADNPNTEKVEFEVYQEGTQFFYRYKTQQDSYPKNYAQKIEFKPAKGSLELRILSTPRNKKSDTSGINLKVVNKTGLSLSIKIENDDARKPRVKIIERVGDISVTK